MSVQAAADDEFDRRAALADAEQRYAEAANDLRELEVNQQDDLARARDTYRKTAGEYRAAFLDFYGVDMPVPT